MEYTIQVSGTSQEEDTQIEQKQDEKPLHVHAAEILGHIHNRDYGMAESKAGLLRDQLQKGDWTLGAGTGADRTRDDVVQMRGEIICEQREAIKHDRATLLEILEIVNRLNGRDARKDVRAIKSMKSVDSIITKWSAQHDEDMAPIKERMCAFCGRDDPSVICGGDWFCDVECANNHTRDATMIRVHDANGNPVQVIADPALTITIRDDIVEELKDSNIEDLYELYDLDKKDIDRLNNVITSHINEIRDLETTLDKFRDWSKTIGLQDNKIKSLEAELSVREGDYEVLMKVVDSVRQYIDHDYRSTETIDQIFNIVADYLEHGK